MVDVVIPAYNEAESVGHVIAEIPNWVRDIVVVDNNSTDGTGEVAAKAGATVIHQPMQGYGNACLKGLDYINAKEEKPQTVVFLDADYSDYPEEITHLVNKINEGFDLVIGSRAIGQREKGSMMPQQIFGNWLATTMIKVLYGYQYSDLGPFRAITWQALEQIKMQDKNFGWTVEMQVKALKHKLRIAEIPVNYKKRIGVSKITGTIKGTISAGYKIILTIIKYTFT